jgi:sigma-B regulation protein RsbU (phosphoserine phosphatase)
MTKPLEVLTKDVQEISRGNFDQRATVFDNDEIGDVANGINAMAVSIKEYIASLTSVTAEKEKISTELNVANQVQQIYTKMMNSLGGEKKPENETDKS